MADFATSRIHNVGNTGIFNSAINRNMFTPQALNYANMAKNFLGKNVALGLPLGYEYGARKLQENLPQSLQGEGGLADQNPFYGAMGVAVDPEVEETLRYGDPVTDVNYPGGNPIYPQTIQPRVPDRISSPDRPAIPENRGIIDTLKGWTTPSIDFMKKIVEPNTPEENFGLEYFQDRNTLSPSGRILGNQAYDVFAGKNPVSAWGKGMGASSQKRMDTIENTLRTKYDLSDEDIDAVYAGTYSGNARTRLIDRLHNFNRQRNKYTQAFAGTGGTDNITGGKGGNYITTKGGDYKAGDNTINWNPQTTGTRSFHPSQGNVSTTDFQPGSQHHDVPHGTSTTGSFAGKGSGNPWNRAEGGRIGYQDGELVEDEYMAEATPQGMMEENIEEVQGEPSREQLEAIALEIFQLPLEELNEQQLEIVYQAAMEQEPSEEEVQFAAQEGPGEGIASLV